MASVASYIQCLAFLLFAAAAVAWIPNGQQSGSPHIHLSAVPVQLTPAQRDELGARIPYVNVSHGRYYRRNYFTPNDDVVKSWRVTSERPSSDYSYNESTGVVRINTDGTYLIYSQVLYASFRGAHSVIDSVHSKSLVRCVSTYMSHASWITGTCHNDLVTDLHAGDELALVLHYKPAKIILQPESTFWGMLRLGDL